jgi:hypothetical protein
MATPRDPHANAGDAPEDAFVAVASSATPITQPAVSKWSVRRWGFAAAISVLSLIAFIGLAAFNIPRDRSMDSSYPDNVRVTAC